MIFKMLSCLLSVQDEVVLDFKLVSACWFDTFRNCQRFSPKFHRTHHFPLWRGSGATKTRTS
jgi:hypothetical protein